MEETVGVVKNRVNGAFLPDHLGKEVVILGKVLQVHPNGRTFEMKTLDDRVVTISMATGLDTSLSGMIEVHGRATAKNAIMCHKYIEFPHDLSSDFDVDEYNEAVMIINTIPNQWRPTDV